MKLFARKIGMTHIYDQNGAHVPVTVVEVKKTVLSGRKTQEKDGYNALIFAEVGQKSGRKSLNNQFKAIDETIKKVRELKIDNFDNVEGKDGDVVALDSFEVGNKVEVCTKSKGKGFQGTVKRHGFTTGPKTHGSHNFRQPGSIGSTNPDRTVKGKRMPGHMGSKIVTLKNIEIMKLNPDKNYMFLKGSIPGSAKSIMEITKND